MNVLSAVSLHHLPTKLPSQQILQDFCVCEFMLISVMSDCFVYHSVCVCSWLVFICGCISCLRLMSEKLELVAVRQIKAASQRRGEQGDVARRRIRVNRDQ